ncbi:hypothetical protein G6O69_26880 [Pseudenhygromyxa sp. WMMC2535]|uniref:hypothetical protein n=1 Tax=Pseudenhygromyxa sp. WMMC2535 TaxID=2712867 RepID=UPI00159627EF|nr:hypothetical protein [Pseudenhygromyxa sp. WMMC2535]NVB41492.1 hypothetical protein [Pseudenhygromyxa sp. WMMC2535]
MARSNTTRRRDHHPLPRFEEQRPVLQLPLESPQWREPARPGAGSDEGKDQRGVAVIDFYI